MISPNGHLVNSTPSMNANRTPGHVPARSAPAFLFANGFAIILLVFFTGLTLRAQTPVATPSDSTRPMQLAASSSAADSLAALKSDRTNAWRRVLEIVNRPVVAYRRTPGMSVATTTEGWFHEGASKPDFNTVDVRQTQEFPYANSRYITSDLNPGLVFLGAELEFNAQLKYFYTNRSLPKRRLTEAEMIEINDLYRIIGRCEDEIAQLRAPPSSSKAKAMKANADDADAPDPGQSFEHLRAVPRGTRMLFGGIAIGFLVVILVVRRVVKKTP